jgi:hypothetical protein
LKSPDSLLLVIGQSDQVVRCPKDQIEDPHARVLEVQVSLCLLPELGEISPTISTQMASVGERPSID